MKSLYVFNPTKAGKVVGDYLRYFSGILDLSQPVWCEVNKDGFGSSGLLHYQTKDNKSSRVGVNLSYFDPYIPNGRLEDWA